jgi:predicted nucleotide-binding protein
MAPARTKGDEIADRFRGPTGIDAIAEVLSRLPLFGGDRSVAASAARQASIETAEQGDTVLTQDSPDTDILFILAGSVSIARNGRADGTLCLAPTHIGEMAMIDRTAKRSASAVALEPTVLARLARPLFAAIADANPSMWQYLAIELGDRIRHRLSAIRPRNSVPRVFIASSKEGLLVTKQLADQFKSDPIEIVPWVSDGIFDPGLTNIEALERELDRADFAILLLSADDRILSRWRWAKAPRDNVIFELGMFIGGLGRRRAFILIPAWARIKIPSDLLGVTTVRYANGDDFGVLSTLRRIVLSLGPK